MGKNNNHKDGMINKWEKPSRPFIGRGELINPDGKREFVEFLTDGSEKRSDKRFSGGWYGWLSPSRKREKPVQAPVTAASHMAQVAAALSPVPDIVYVETASQQPRHQISLLPPELQLRRSAPSAARSSNAGAQSDISGDRGEATVPDPGAKRHHPR